LHLPERSMVGQLRLVAFRLALTMAGWNEGDNLQIDIRWSGGDRALADRYAADLAAANPDVLVGSDSEMALALQRATKTIPIVFVEAIDPVGYGLVADLYQPGGNITGLMMFGPSLAAKWLELLKQIKPSITRVAVMHDPSVPVSQRFIAAIEKAAASNDVQVVSTALRSEADIRQFFDNLGRPANLGAIALPAAIMAQHRSLIVEAAVAHRLPIVSAFRDDPERGVLASYGADGLDQYRPAAFCVDRILKGETPAELPVQTAWRYLFVINTQTARAIGLDPSPSLLASADEIIK
jgi:putative ABC transport system substrate-binding protein